MAILYFTSGPLQDHSNRCTVKAKLCFLIYIEAKKKDVFGLYLVQ